MPKQNKLTRLENRKLELIRNIQACRDYKKEITGFVLKLNSEYEQNLITYEQYYNKLNKTLENRTPQQWTTYYDQCIKHYNYHLDNCKKSIKREEGKAGITQVIAVFGILMMLGIGLFFLRPTLTGLVVEYEAENYTQNLNLRINQSSGYEWQPEHLGILRSARISGTILGNGSVKIYLENKLMLDSSQLEKERSGIPLITGLVIGELNESNEDMNESEEDIVVLDIIENTANETEDITNKTEVIEYELATENVTDITETVEDEPVIENITDTTEVIEKESVIENITNATESVEEKIIMPDEIRKQIEIKKISFNDNCIATCSLRLNKTNYELRFEIENAVLKLESIRYVIEEILTENITLPKENITNITSQVAVAENITKSEELIQGRAEINKPVKWIKKIKLNKTADNLTVILPQNISGIKVRKIVDKVKHSITEEKLKLIEAKEIKSIRERSVTGQVTKELQEVKEEIELVIEDSVEEVEVVYNTKGPEIIEEEISEYLKKIIVISDIHYENITAYTKLRDADKDSIKLYRTTGGIKEPTEIINYTDEDNDNLIDKISWIVPHLSNETYELIIEISKAEHLDSNRSFISDIYNEVKALDDVWSEEIPDGDYVRVAFERNLTNERDITLWPRIRSGNPRIEIYEFNETGVIAEFTSLNSDEYNKVFLAGLRGEQDVFDLKVLDGSMEIDHIIDPVTADFKIQRRCETPASGTATVTLTAGTDYTAPANNSYAFIRMVNTRLSGTGDTVGGGTQEADDWTWYISDPDFSGGSVAFTRAGTTNPQRFCWEIIEYIGEAGGSNEIIVRKSGTATYGSSDTTVNGPVSSVNDDNDVLVFITGQQSVETSDQDEVGAGMSTSEWVSASDLPRFTRGFTGNDANSLSYAVVEFTGSNWAVERISHTFSAVGATETESITDVGSLSRAFFHAQFFRDAEEGLDDSGARMWFSATDEISFYINSGADDPGNTHHAVVWVVRNSDTDTQTAMNVQHKSGSRAKGDTSEGANNEEDEWTETITAVNDTAQTSIMGETGESGGSGTAFPRGWISLYLNSESGVKLYQSDDGQPQQYSFQVVEWPSSSVPEEDYEYPLFSSYIETPENNTAYAKGTLYEFNVTIISTNGTAGLEFNGVNYTAANTSDVFSVSLNDLAVGTYSYYWWAYGNGTSSNFNSTTSRTYTINKAASSVNLTLNSSESNITVIQGDSIDLNCSTILGDSGATLTLYREGTTINTGTSPIGNTTVFNTVQLENITCIYSGSENYTLSNVTWWVNVISATNTVPIISDISDIPDQSITEAGVSYVEFFVLASDKNGVDDLNDSSLNATFSKAGETTRSNSSCSWTSDINTTTANYTCTIELWYWDGAGAWNASASVLDLSNEGSLPYNETFTLLETTAMVMSPNSLSWDTMLPGGLDKLSNNDPITINNTGNKNIASGNVRVKAYDLVGETNSDYSIPAANFTVNVNDACEGTKMQNNTVVGIINSILSAGNNSAGQGQEQLYFCLEEVPALIQQTYSTVLSWVIDII